MEKLMPNFVEMAKEGDEIYNPTPGGKLKVKQSCLKEYLGYWYCLNHDCTISSAYAKEVHISHGTHRLAWACSEHGIEEP